MRFSQPLLWGFIVLQGFSLPAWAFTFFSHRGPDSPSSRYVDLLRQELNALDALGRTSTDENQGAGKASATYERNLQRYQRLTEFKVATLEQQRLDAAINVSPQLKAYADGVIADYRSFLKTQQLGLQSYDLRQQWTPNSRAQDYAGTCSIFATVGLFEAAYFREYGERVDFSEKWIAREVVQESLTKNLAQGVPFTVNPQTTLPFLKQSGICREPSYPYTDESLHYLETDQSHRSVMVATQNFPWIAKAQVSKDAPSLAQIDVDKKTAFLKTFGDSKNSEYLNCDAEAKSFAPKFKGFEAQCFSKIAPTDLHQFIRQGIPLYIEVASPDDRAGPLGTEAHSGVGHAVDISTWDSIQGRFFVHNSWGFMNHFYHSVSLSEFMDKNGKDRAVVQDFCVVLTPKDLKRMCLRLETLSSAAPFIQPLCQKYGFTAKQLSEDL